MSTLTMDEALEVLGLSSVEGLDLATLKNVSRNAKRRWHPDKIAHTGPNEETIKRHEFMFNRVGDAVDMLTRIITGERSKRDTSSEERETQLRFDIAGKFARVKAKWAEIRKSKLQVEKVERVLFEGWTIRELLKEERVKGREILLAFALMAATITYLLFGLSVQAITAMTHLPKAVENGLIWGGAIVWALDILVLLVSTLPLADVWLPAGDRLISGAWHGSTFLFLKWPFFAGVGGLTSMAIGYPLKWFFYEPMRLILSIWGSKRVGKVKVKHRTFAGVSEDDIKELLEVKGAEDLSWAQVVYINHLIEAYPEIFAAEGVK